MVVFQGTEHLKLFLLIYFLIENHCKEIKNREFTNVQLDPENPLRKERINILKDFKINNADQEMLDGDSSAEETQSDNEESENDTHGQYSDTFPPIVLQQLIKREKHRTDSDISVRKPHNKMFTNLNTGSLGTFNFLPVDLALQPHAGPPPDVVTNNTPVKSVQVIQPSPVDPSSFPSSTITRFPDLSSSILFGSSYSLSEEIFLF
jgi:hypothetical protein